MLHAVAPAALEHVQRADQIAFDIRMWILDRVPDPRLGRQMDDSIDGGGAEKRLHADAIREVKFFEPESAPGTEPRKTRFLERRIVIGIEVVEADDLVAAREQALGHVITDEARGTGDQHAHSGTSD